MSVIIKPFLSKVNLNQAAQASAYYET